MPIQATLEKQPVSPVLLNPLKFFVTLAPRVWKLRGAGVDVPGLLKLVFPFSITTRMPLYFTVPVDTISYVTWPWVQRYVIDQGDPVWKEIESQYERLGIPFSYVLLAFGVEDAEERYALQRFLDLNRTVSADGSIIQTVPQMWFRDP